MHMNNKATFLLQGPLKLGSSHLTRNEFKLSIDSQTVTWYCP